MVCTSLIVVLVFYCGAWIWAIHHTVIMILCIILIIPLSATWFYYYEPGVIVDGSDSGHTIPLPPEFGQ